MKTIFVDTLYWVAMTHPGDQWHAAALAATKRITGAVIVTTDEVLVEYLNALAGVPRIRAAAARAVGAMKTTDDVEIVPQSSGSFAGLELYENRPDKGYSLTDCVSMQVMRERGITEVLSRDHHFEQEGFTLLIQPHDS